MTDLFAVTHSTSMQVHKTRLVLRNDSDGQDLRMDRRRKMGAFKICGVHVYLHQRCAYRVAKNTPEMQECLKRRMLSIMLSVNCVCERTFDHHEWVSESTLAMHEEQELMGRELDHGSCIPCVVQWCTPWFSAPAR